MLTAALLLLAPPAAPGDWPRWMGPDPTGVSPGTGSVPLSAGGAEDLPWPRFRGPDGAGVAKAELPADLGPKSWRWRVELAGPGHSSPVVAGDRIVLTCVDPQEALRYVVCHDTATGDERWRTGVPFEEHGQHALNSHAASTPALDTERVFVAWTTGALFEVRALALADGRELWRVALGGSSSQHGSGASPVVLGGVVVVSNEHEDEGSFLIGLDAETGEERWRHGRESLLAAYGTPTARTAPDGTVELLFASTAHGLSALDPKTGALRWELGGLFEKRCVHSPVVAGSVIFQAAGEGGGGKECAAVTPPADGSEARVAWRLRRSIPYVPTPVAANGLLFLWSDGGVVTCLRPSSGEEVWRERVDGRFFGSPVCADGRLLAISTDGTLFSIPASEEFAAPTRVELGEPSQATPAVAHDVLYLRTERHLIAVGEPLSSPAEGTER